MPNTERTMSVGVPPAFAGADDAFTPTYGLRSLPQHLQAEPSLHRIKVAVAMKQRVVVDDAEGRNHHVDRLANGDALSPQAAIIGCALQGHRPAQHGFKGQTAQQSARAPEVGVVIEALQHFGEDDVARQHGLGGQQAIQAIRFSACNAVEIVDPDG